MKVFRRSQFISMLAVIVSTCFFVRCFANPDSSKAGLVVVTSIKPLALLVEPLLRGEDQVSVLLPSNSSPHHFAMQVSHLTQLSEADLIVWVGPDLERFLQKALRQSDPLTVLGIGNATTRKEGVEPGSHSHSEDPHIWLSIEAMRAATRLIAERLQLLSPEYKEHYRQSEARQLMELARLEDQLRSEAQLIEGKPFVVYHPAYSELVSDYRLSQIGHVTLSPDMPPSAKKLYQLKKTVVERDAKCLFVEESHANDRIEVVAQRLELRLAQLDPLGKNSDSYPGLMHKLMSDMQGCLLE